MAPATNTVKVTSRLKLGSGCCAVGCVSHTYIYLFVATHQNIKTFPKGFVEKHEHVMHV